MYIFFTKLGCSYCDLAKKFCRENDIEHKSFEISTTEEISKAKSYIPNLKPDEKVKLPIVLDFAYNYIGGYEDMIKHYYANKGEK